MVKGTVVGMAPAPEPLQAMIWDLGNVLVSWDRERLYRQLFPATAEGLVAMRAFLTEVLPMKPFNERIDLGENPAAVCEEFIAANPTVDPSLIRAYATRWHEMLSGPIEANARLLREVRAVGLPCFALSNWGVDMSTAQELYPVLLEFDGRVISGEEGVIKPHPAIFNIVLQRFDLEAPRCLFVDDNADNIAAADSLGFRTHLVTTSEKLRAAVLHHGVKLGSVHDVN
jgi:2-haloacid dehalogenase